MKEHSRHRNDEMCVQCGDDMRELFEMTDEEVDAELREAGIDPEEMAKRMLPKVMEMIAKAKGAKPCG